MIAYLDSSVLARAYLVDEDGTGRQARCSSPGSRGRSFRAMKRNAE